MQKKFFLGIDVSKHTLDVAFVIRQSSGFSNPVWKQFHNTQNGLNQLKRWLNEMHIPLSSQTIIVIENTGIYHRLLWQFCSALQVDLCIENAAQVKWSMGIARAKNDKVDSRRLALYAARHADRLKPTPSLHSGIMHLKDLMMIRNKIVVQIGGIKTTLKELKHVSTSGAETKTIKKLTQPALDGLQRSLKMVEKDIKSALRKEDALFTVYKRLITIPGIGHVTAIYLICCSNMFTMCSSGKQLACYCGVVPFDHQSGISIKSKQHVHRMANKELKRLLHLCALSCIKNYPEFKDYYDRKKQEGKHSMSVLNAIKNKVILRAFAVVKNERDYVDNYKKAA